MMKVLSLQPDESRTSGRSRRWPTNGSELVGNGAFVRLVGNENKSICKDKEHCRPDFATPQEHARISSTPLSLQKDKHHSCRCLIGLIAWTTAQVLTDVQ